MALILSPGYWPEARALCPGPSAPHGGGHLLRSLLPRPEVPHTLSQETRPSSPADHCHGSVNNTNHTAPFKTKRALHYKKTLRTVKKNI